MAQILIFGDSIIHGFWDADGGWVSHLKKFLESLKREDYYLVYNLGIDGDGSEGVFKRIIPETEMRTWDDEAIIIISIGINDSIVFNQTNKPVVEPHDYQVFLEKIIQKARRYSKKIILVGLFPVDERKVDPIPWLENHSYKNEYVKMYEQIIESVANLNQVHFVPLFDKFQKDAKKLLADGVHPNSKGHKAIFELIKEYLIENGITEV